MYLFLTFQTVDYPNNGDFWIDKKILFEIGGKSKSGKQIKETSNAYIAADNGAIKPSGNVIYGKRFIQH